MAKWLWLVALSLVAAPAFAQVFPRLEREKVEARIQSGKVEEEPEPEITDEPEPEVDGEKALARYKELLAEYTKNERNYHKNITSHTDEMPEEIGQYLEGQLLLNIGMYKEARRALSKVGHEIDKDDLVNREQKRIADEILEGRAYYLWGVAAALEEWRDFETKEEAVEAWIKAEEAYADVRNDLARLVKRDDIPNGETNLQAMQVWTASADGEWEALFVAQKAVKEYPGNLNSWSLLVQATRSAELRGRNLYTPHLLKHRAALQVIKEFWPEHESVKDGDVDVGLAGTVLAVADFDNWEAMYERKDYHSPKATMRLNTAKFAAGLIVNAIKALKEGN